ncbi:hypothetical protein AB1Y20_020952 [Prymnesium parvum]|uniref:Uncharacterized protein n=1 Tax=Prymnesium parvum TaxID=97485 RepID=A0AB34JI91_PRYPA
MRVGCLLLLLAGGRGETSCESVSASTSFSTCAGCIASGCAWSVRDGVHERCTPATTCSASGTPADEAELAGDEGESTRRLQQDGVQCIVEMSGCCDEDDSHARAASWLCDDECNTCSCEDGVVKASGCKSGAKDGSGQPNEAYVVQLAIGAVLLCFVTFMAICYIMLCWRRKAHSLPTKEFTSPEEEEEDQLAAGD